MGPGSAPPLVMIPCFLYCLIFRAHVAKLFSYLQAEVENVPSDIYEYLDKIDKDDEEGEESQVIKLHIKYV